MEHANCYMGVSCSLGLHAVVGGTCKFCMGDADVFPTRVIPLLKQLIVVGGVQSSLSTKDLPLKGCTPWQACYCMLVSRTKASLYLRS